MPWRRLNDYAGITIYLIGIIFIGGGLYTKVGNIEVTLEEHKVYMTSHDAIEKVQDLSIKQLQIEAANRDKFYQLMKDLLRETKQSNKETADRMQSINETVIETKFKVESIEKRMLK